MGKKIALSLLGFTAIFAVAAVIGALAHPLAAAVYLAGCAIVTAMAFATHPAAPATDRQEGEG